MKTITTRSKKSAGTKRYIGGVMTDTRSRITNGKVMLPGIDGRSASAKRYRDLYKRYLKRTHGKHNELCRTLAGLILQRELLDAAIIRGERVDPVTSIKLAGAIRRGVRELDFVSDESNAAIRQREREDREALLA